MIGCEKTINALLSNLYVNQPPDLHRIRKRFLFTMMEGLLSQRRDS